MDVKEEGNERNHSGRRSYCGSAATDTKHVRCSEKESAHPVVLQVLHISELKFHMWSYCRPLILETFVPLKHCRQPSKQKIKHFVENLRGFWGCWCGGMWGLLRKAKNIAVEPGAGFLVAHIEREKKLDSLVGTRPQAPSAPQGIYLYGNVGCGEY